MSEALSEPIAVLDPVERRETAKVLHVGCGVYNRAKLPPVFQTGWREIRLDIDPDVRPDVVSSITDMGAIGDDAIDAVYSSHNVEHLFPHEVPLALAEMRRVVKPGGFAFITLPDLQEVARHVAEGKLEEPLYMSPLGPISALDIIFGHRPALAEGNIFMAHHTGFTAVTLSAGLVNAGFSAVLTQRDPPGFRLTAIAFRTAPDSGQLKSAQATLLPAPDRPATLYQMAV
jgi:SAM-dependent methyltransferase